MVIIRPCDIFLLISTLSILGKQLYVFPEFLILRVLATWMQESSFLTAVGAARTSENRYVTVIDDLAGPLYLCTVGCIMKHLEGRCISALF